MRSCYLLRNNGTLFFLKRPHSRWLWEKFWIATSISVQTFTFHMLSPSRGTYINDYSVQMGQFSTGQQCRTRTSLSLCSHTPKLVLRDGKICWDHQHMLESETASVLARAGWFSAVFPFNGWNWNGDGKCDQDKMHSRDRRMAHGPQQDMSSWISSSVAKWKVKGWCFRTPAAKAWYQD